MKYNRIKVILAEKDITSKELASRLDVTRTTVSRWINNQAQPGIETLFKIAKVLNVDVRELLNPTQTR